MSSRKIHIEYSPDSLGNMPDNAFRALCRKIAARRGLTCEFTRGFRSRESIDGQDVDSDHKVAEKAFQEWTSTPHPDLLETDPSAGDAGDSDG